MKKRKSLFFALCLMVTSLCLFVSCGFWKMESGTEENFDPSVEEVSPDNPQSEALSSDDSISNDSTSDDSISDDQPSEEPPKEEASTNSGIQFPEVPLP